jgi:hypothetical protein
MKRLFIVVAVSVALLGATAARAKEPPQTIVRGRSLATPTKRTCLHLNHRGLLAAQINGSIGEPFHGSSKPRPAPFYVVMVRYQENHDWDWSFLYVPSRGLIRHTTSVGMVTPGTRDVYWRTAPTSVARAFETLSKRLRPFPAPRSWH